MGPAVRANYRKLALLQFIKANSCLRASASVPLSTSAAVRSRLCAPPSVSAVVPRERVMRTAGASLTKQGSLAEKRAGAPAFPGAWEKQNSFRRFPVSCSPAHFASGQATCCAVEPSPTRVQHFQKIQGGEASACGRDIIFPPLRCDVGIQVFSACEDARELCFC